MVSTGEDKGLVVWPLSHVQLFAAPWTVAPPGSSVDGIAQARTLEWVAISLEIFQIQGSNQVSCLAGRQTCKRRL